MFEDLLKLRLACNLAADVADGAAQKSLEFTQAFPGPLELFGMRIALLHDQGELAHLGVALP